MRIIANISTNSPSLNGNISNDNIDLNGNIGIDEFDPSNLKVRVTNLENNAVGTINLSYDNQTSILTLTTKNIKNEDIGTPQTVVISGGISDIDYDNTTKSLIVTLSNGDELTVSLKDSFDELAEQIPTKLSELTNDTGFITSLVDNLTNYYLKSETYTKTEVNNIISTIPKVKLEIVQTLPEAGPTYWFDNSHTIYLAPKSTSQTQNIYDEYLCTRSGIEGSYIYSWEKIGDTEIDLSNYVQKTFTIAGIDLQDNITKPELQIVLTDSTHNFVTDTEKSTWNAKYDKPVTGIPKSDLDTDVQDSLDLANSALQSINSQLVTNALGYTPYNSTNPSGYTKVENSSTNGNIKIDNVETTVYILPNDVARTSDIPTDVSSFTNDSNYQNASQVSSAIDNKAVRYDTNQQGLTSVEQSNARINIGALGSHQSIKTLNTDNITSQITSSNETITGSGSISLHKIAKTGTASDLIGYNTLAQASDLTALSSRVSTTEGDITTINNKFQSGVSSSNPATSESFVNSSINALAAFFITRTAAGDNFNTYTQLNSATIFYSGGESRIPTQNDYTYVRFDETKGEIVTGYSSFTTTTDYIGHLVIYNNEGVEVTSSNKDSLDITPGTTIAYDNLPTTRYSYQGGTYPNGQWDFQLIVNNSALTSAQMMALNSGITSTLVGKITTNEQDIRDIKIEQTTQNNNISNNATAIGGLTTRIGTAETDITSLQSNKVDKTTTVNNKPLSGNVTLTPGDIGAEPSFTKNTAFNKNFETNANNIQMDGTASAGSLDTVARADHRHPSDTSKQDVLTAGDCVAIQTINNVLTISADGYKKIEEVTGSVRIADLSTGIYRYANIKSTGQVYYSGATNLSFTLDFTDVTGSYYWLFVYDMTIEHTSAGYPVYQAAKGWYLIANNKIYYGRTTASSGTYSVVDYEKLLTQTSTAKQVYATDSNGNQTTLTYGTWTDADKLVQRISGGQIMVPNTPTNNTDAVSKNYVDSADTNLQNQLTPTDFQDAQANNSILDGGYCKYTTIGKLVIAYFVDVTIKSGVDISNDVLLFSGLPKCTSDSNHIFMLNDYSQREYSAIRCKMHNSSTDMEIRTHWTHGGAVGENGNHQYATLIYIKKD